MTSVAAEASIVPHRSARPERTPQGARADGGFAELMDGETRPEPKPARQSQARDDAKPAEKTTQASSGTPEADAAVADEYAAVQTDAAGETNDKAIVTMADAAATEAASPAPAITPAAPPPLPTTVPTAAPAIGAAMPVPPAAPLPPAEIPAQSAPGAPAAPPAPSRPGPAEASQPVAGNAAASAQAEALPPSIKAAATGDAGNSHKPVADAPENAPTQSVATEQTPAEGQKLPKPAQAPAHVAAAARPAPAPRSPDLQDAIAMPDENSPAKPALDPSLQLATPAPAHSVSTQTATPQAVPVSAAQPVPANALAVEIAAQARSGNSRFEIRLDPPELGRIDVRLDVDRDGNVTSRLVIERADTYDLLRRDQSTLERALQQAGLKTSDNALEFSLRDQGHDQRHDADDPSRGTRALIQEAEVAPSEAASGYARLLAARGGIDIRV